jgi:acyl carrier protein
VPDARLADLAQLDSLSLAEIAAALDEEFGIRVPGDDLTTVQTVAELSAVVERAPRRSG